MSRGDIVKLQALSDKSTPSDEDSKILKPTEEKKELNCRSVTKSLDTNDVPHLVPESVEFQEKYQPSETMDSPASTVSAEENDNNMDLTEHSAAGEQRVFFSPINRDISTFPSNLSSILQPEEKEYNTSSKNLELIDRYFRQIAFWGLAVWIALGIFAYQVCPDENIVQVAGIERNAVVLAFAIQLIAFSSRLMPFFLLRSESPVNGLFIASTMVQFVAMMTNFTMAFFPSPVVIDPITDRRVHLLRWCEWVPLAFVMTFMTETVGMEDVEKNVFKAYRLGYSQCISTLCGMIFPFCVRKELWVIIMSFSCFLYFFMFPRLYQKRQKYVAHKVGKTVEEFESFHRAKYSYQLLLICTVMWTLLVVSYFFATFAPLIAPADSLLANPAYTMISECSVDVIIKVLYLNIINQIQDAIFDDKARSRRRLEELRSMMTVVWESSSDIIIISVRRSDTGLVTTMVSPTFKKTHPGKTYENVEIEKNGAIIFELQPSENTKDHQTVKGSIPLHSKPTSVSFLNSSDGFEESTHRSPFFNEALSSLGDVVVKAWASIEKESLFMHNLVTLGGSVIQSEAKLNRFEDHSLIVVLRDISERFMRFEAEKKVVSETTARLKDAEANRFTRHEVKNGLLAAIALCDNLKSLRNESSKLERSISCASLKSQASTQDVSRYIDDLDSTLHEVLDTVLAEAMSREVIYEVYRPVLERVDIAAILGDSSDMSLRERFPIVCSPDPFPAFYFDVQLLKYIHRNAISNAIKYGKKEGAIRTELKFDSELSELTMSIINLPGEGHSDLVAMGEAACQSVFVQGKRLHSYVDSCKKSHIISSGDGAWIVQKCAKTLGGKCTIRFEEKRTVFRFRCRADPYLLPSEDTSGESHKFQVPEDTFGVVIDDSKIQRKLMAKFLSSLGVKPERRIVLGKDGDEIRNFQDFVVNLVQTNPNSYFLIIVDENLDLDDMDYDPRFSSNERLSGSQCVENFRSKLSYQDERRILALIRSANDSAKEFALYNSRAHGFIAKAPMKDDHIIEMIRHLWTNRFRENDENSM